MTHRPFIAPRNGPHRETAAHRWWGSWEVAGVRDDESALGIEVGERVLLHARMFASWCSGFRRQLREATERHEKAAEGRLFA